MEALLGLLRDDPKSLVLYGGVSMGIMELRTSMCQVMYLPRLIKAEVTAYLP